MTELDIQKRLFEKFLSIDDYAVENGYTGQPYIIKDDQGDLMNVHLPNEPFKVPDDKRWYDVTFRSNEPVDASIMEGSQYRFTGVMYIDILTPQDVGEKEAEGKYRWIANLFNSADIDYIDIMRVYISTKGNDADCYRLQVAIEWEADIDKE